MQYLNAFIYQEELKENEPRDLLAHHTSSGLGMKLQCLKGKPAADCRLPLQSCRLHRNVSR